MKKLFAAIALLFGAIATMSAQQVCFWTDEYKALPIRIYVDEQFVGEITYTDKTAPEYGAEGTVSIEMTPGTHKVEAVNAYGYLYDGWPGRIRPAEDRVNYIKIRKEHFTRYNDIDYILADPFFYDPFYVPGPPYHGHVDRDRYGSDDDGDYELDEAYAITLAIAAATAFVTAATASIVNWNYPDARFPYFAAGARTEYLPGVMGLRSVGTLKGRIGNFGGMSFMLEGGEAYYADRGLWDPSVALGFGWAYGAFEVDFRYQLPWISQYRFASLDFSYDWFIGNHFAINFSAGLGLSGYQYFGNNRWEGVEIPLGVGLRYAF